MIPLSERTWWTLWSICALGAITAIVIDLMQGPGWGTWLYICILLIDIGALVRRLRERDHEP